MDGVSVTQITQLMRTAVLSAMSMMSCSQDNERRVEVVSTLYHRQTYTRTQTDIHIHTYIHIVDSRRHGVTRRHVMS